MALVKDWSLQWKIEMLVFFLNAQLHFADQIQFASDPFLAVIKRSLHREAASSKDSLQVAKGDQWREAALQRLLATALRGAFEASLVAQFRLLN